MSEIDWPYPPDAEQPRHPGPTPNVASAHQQAGAEFLAAADAQHHRHLAEVAAFNANVAAHDQQRGRSGGPGLIWLCIIAVKVGLVMTLFAVLVIVGWFAPALDAKGESPRERTPQAEEVGR